MEQYEQNLAYTDEEKVILYCKNIIKAVERTRDVLKQGIAEADKMLEDLGLNENSEILTWIKAEHLADKMFISF